MALLDASFIPNPFEKLFSRLKSTAVSDREDAMRKNSVGVSETELNFNERAGAYGTGTNSSYALNFDSIYTDKKDRIVKYREMSKYPEVSDSIENICDEAITEDFDGTIVKIGFVDDEKVPSNIQDKMEEISEYIFTDVLRTRENLWRLFKKWLIEGELYLEKIMSTDEKHIATMKVLPSFNIFPYYEANVIKGYIHGVYDPSKRYTQQDVKLTPEQVAYSNYGDFTNEDLLKPESFLETGQKVFNQLKQMEDAACVYRVSRASERLIFNIEVGNMPPNKAREYLKKQMNDNRKQVSYDPSTGAISQQYKTQPINDNYWFPQTDGKGSKVEQLPGACLSLDTIIPLLDGRKLPLNDIIAEFESGKTLWAYSCDPKSGKPAPGLISWAGVTRKNTEVLKITFDNGKSVVCTPDHKFPIRDGAFVEAKDLKIDESLWAFNEDSKQIHGQGNKYHQVWDNENQKWVFTHRMVADLLKNILVNEVVLFQEYDEKKNTVHHVDFDRYNNNPENLVWAGSKDHYKYHFNLLTPEKAREYGKRGHDKYMERLTNDPIFRERIVKQTSDKMQEWHDSLDEKGKADFCKAISDGIHNVDPETRKKNIEAHKKNFAKGRQSFKHKLETDPEFARKFKEAVINGWTEDKRLKHAEVTRTNHLKLWESEEYATQHRLMHIESQKIVYDSKIIRAIIDLIKDKKQFGVKKIAAALNSNTEIVNHFLELNKGKSVPNWNSDKKFTPNIVKNSWKEFGYKSWEDFVINNSNYNHRVVSIEYLDEKIDTGTLTIDKDEKYHGYHTFALDCGVFTKNSNLEAIADIVMFKKKLYKSLKIPRSRWDDENTTLFSGGKGNEISREEIKFNLFIKRCQNKFKRLLLDFIISEASLRKIDQKYLDPDLYDINYTKSNYYAEYKNIELTLERLSICNTAYPSLYNPQTNPSGLFSAEYMMKNMMSMTDDEWLANKKLLDKEKKKAEKEGLEKERDFGGGLDLERVDEIPFSQDKFQDEDEEQADDMIEDHPKPKLPKPDFSKEIL